MPTRTTVQIEPVSGEVVNVIQVVSTDERMSSALPANTKDITNDPQRDAIMAGLKRWDGAAWVNVVRAARPTAPLVASFTDRQLLEGIAKYLGVAR